MSLDDLPVPIQRQQAFREALYRLGYEDEQVQCAIGAAVIEIGFVVPPGHHIVSTHLVLKLPPAGSAVTPDFTATCGSVEVDWTMERVAPLWNALPTLVRQANYHQHVSLMVLVELAGALRKKGIVIPNLQRSTL